MIEVDQKEKIAKVCHEAIRAYSISLDDHSHVPWEILPELQKESSIKGVACVLKNGSITATEIHTEWVDYKTKQGWVYGVVKNFDKKEHPCLVSFEDLCKEQKAKDYIFIAIVNAMKECQELTTRKHGDHGMEMNFSEALEKLKDGKKLRQLKWKDRTYIEIRQNINIYHDSVVQINGYESRIWEITFCHIFSDDWAVYEEKSDEEDKEC